MTSKKVATVSGVIALPSKTRLPSDAIAYITLVDVTPRQDSSGGIIARQTLNHPTSETIAFKLDYDSAKICADCLYAIQVQIVTQGKVIYRNASAYPVITRGKPTIVNVMLKPVQRVE
ncbi:YbaY family lipoprotein [Leptolyngbya sp. AN03gr2]|uniref:YbaY family lipoprotein n=1 Tax=unclassified Leptolyngbya TaxID=2650499 RepID=UPI003D317AD7